jgi:hypothetical protein
MEPTDFLK